MPFRHPRQIPSGAVTLSAVSAGSSNSLDTDPNQSGTNSGLVVPTITILSTASPTTPTESASSTSTSTAGDVTINNKVNIGAIVGIIIGVLAILSVALVTFMTIRHRKTLENSRARAKSMARKSWSRVMKDEKPTELQMRATSHASFADPKPRQDDPSSLVPALHFMHPETALPSRNPHLIAQGLSSNGNFTSGASAPPSPPPPPSRSVDESHIPNPFASPSATPTHSRNASHASAPSSDTQHSLALAALSSFSPHTPQYAHASMITASSASEYPSEQSSFGASPAEAVKPAERKTPTPARLSRKQSAKVAEESRSRELKAMQDLISALDERAQDKRTPPTAFSLNVDTNTSSGKSRLSMGEGLVTPGGHSIRDEDNFMMYDEDGNSYWEHDPLSNFDQQEFPLPPADVFRAALSPSDVKAKAKAGKEKGKSSNPFQG